MENKRENVHARKPWIEGTRVDENDPLLEPQQCEFQSRSVLIATFHVTTQSKLPSYQSGIFRPDTHYRKSLNIPVNMTIRQTEAAVSTSESERKEQHSQLLLNSSVS